MQNRTVLRKAHAHYGADTRIGAANPEKLTWVRERAGYYRKIWWRPTIVGPADASVRLKTRKWDARPRSDASQRLEPQRPGTAATVGA